MPERSGEQQIDPVDLAEISFRREIYTTDKPNLDPQSIFTKLSEVHYSFIQTRGRESSAEELYVRLSNLSNEAAMMARVLGEDENADILEKIQERYQEAAQALLPSEVQILRPQLPSPQQMSYSKAEKVVKQVSEEEKNDESPKPKRRGRSSKKQS